MKLFITIILANTVSVFLFIAVATPWIHGLLDAPADRHIARKFDKAVDRQTVRLINHFNRIQKEGQKR